MDMAVPGSFGHHGRDDVGPQFRTILGVVFENGDDGFEQAI